MESSSSESSSSDVSDEELWVGKDCCGEGLLWDVVGEVVFV